MERRDLLNSLPSEIKEKIAAKFGSINDFYNVVFKLSNDYYKSFMAKEKERVNRALNSTGIRYNGVDGWRGSV